MRLVILFVCFYSMALTFSPLARFQTLNTPLRLSHWIGVIPWAIGFTTLLFQARRSLPDHDRYILPIAALLSGWGLVTIWRLDSALGLRQTIWLILAMVVFFFGLGSTRLLSLLRRYKYVWLVSGLILTSLTFVFGVYPAGEGPRLWLELGNIYLQPSEPLKLLLVIYLAAYFADRLPLQYSLAQNLVPTLLVIGLSLLILIAQRDLGAASLFLVLYATILFLVTNRRRMVILSGVGLIVAGFVGIQMFAVIHQRVIAWLNPWEDPSGRSYQIIQSLLAIASGKIFGSGPGMGNPGLVPIANSDFIYSALAEETGLLGGIAIFLLFGMLVCRGLICSLRAPYTYQRYLAGGISVYFAAQSLLILGGNLRLAPLTGVTLPFMSYGGSSLLTTFLALLCLVLISNHEEEEAVSLPDGRPYLLIGGVMMLAFFGLALSAGWWSVVRSQDLLARTDNPRRGITDRYIRRGSLLDRDDAPLNVSEGNPGSISRMTTYPPLAATLGYTHPTYGQNGLEASLDSYLRGTEGIAPYFVWMNELLYNVPPPGLDIRLSLDLDLQKIADDLLGDHKGAAILLNAQSGEILVLASHPYIDTNNLDAMWETWIKDEGAPFLNRATQAHYPLGDALSPFLLIDALQEKTLPSWLPETLGGDQSCISGNSKPDNWGSALAKGCVQTINKLKAGTTREEMLSLFNRLDLVETPLLSLPQAEPKQSSSTYVMNATAEEIDLKITPLQLALAAGIFSAEGWKPAPRLTLSFQTPDKQWHLFSASTGKEIYAADLVASALKELATRDSQLTWQILGRAGSEVERVSWFVGGTMSNTGSVPLTLVVMLEEDDLPLVNQIGEELFAQVLH